MKRDKTVRKVPPAKAVPAVPPTPPGPRWQVFATLSGLWQKKSLWPWGAVELIVAISLSVAYYYLVKSFAFGVLHNSTNLWVFSSCSVPNFHLNQLGDVWRGRLSGLLLSGWLFDWVVKNPNALPAEQYSILFAAFQAVWLFLLFLVVMLSLRYSLFINLGIFAGQMYDFSPASGLYFYPWDIPATLFFTLALLFFERRQMWLMVLAACVGGFFKETVVVCALLPLFARHWPWWKRCLAGGLIVAVYVLGKSIMLKHLHLPAAAFSMGNAKSLAGLLKPTILIANLKELVSPTLNHPIFANAGTMVAVLALGWRRRFLPYMALLVAFLAAQLMYGGFNEFRIFMQILPLAMILLCERWHEFQAPAALPAAPGKPAPVWLLRGTFPLLLPLSVVLIAFSAVVPAWRYDVVAESRQPDYQARTLAALKAKAEKGNARAQYQLAGHFVNGQGTNVDLTQAFQWFQKAADQGLADAEFHLGLCYASGSGTTRDFAAALPWFQKAAEQGNTDAQYNLGTLFENALGTQKDETQAITWLQRAAEKGNVDAQNELGMIYYNTRKDNAAATKWFRRAAEQGNTAAENSLAVMYLQGQGVPQDDAQAYNWFQKSAEGGFAEGQNNFASILFSQQRMAEAAEWFRKAADQGHPVAQYNVGQFIEQGLVYPRDVNEALLWYLRSAKQGNGLAEFKLGQMYLEGLGVKTDRVEAYKWLKLAQLQDVPQAQSFLAACASTLSPGDLKAAESAAQQQLQAQQAETPAPPELPQPK